MFGPYTLSFIFKSHNISYTTLNKIAGIQLYACFCFTDTGTKVRNAQEHKAPGNLNI